MDEHSNDYWNIYKKEFSLAAHAILYVNTAVEFIGARARVAAQGCFPLGLRPLPQQAPVFLTSRRATQAKCAYTVELPILFFPGPPIALASQPCSALEATLMSARLLSALFVIALLVSGNAKAEIIFTATLTHDQETIQGAFTTSTGQPRPESFGHATFVLNDAQTSLTMNATIFNIDVTGTQTADTFDNLVAAHIHAPAPPGVNGGVKWGFFGSPDNDNNPDNLIVTPFASDVGGTFSSIWDLAEGNAGTTLTDNLPSILADLSYINFHTVQFPGGEIRGQILQVPEPATLALLGLGLAGFGFARRRRT